MGAAPWHCGVLAGLLLVFDIFVGRYSTDELSHGRLQATQDHLERAFAILRAVATSERLCCVWLRTLCCVWLRMVAHTLLRMVCSCCGNLGTTLLFGFLCYINRCSQVHRLKDVVVGAVAADPDAQDDSDPVAEEFAAAQFRGLHLLVAWKAEEFADFASTQPLRNVMPPPSLGLAPASNSGTASGSAAAPTSPSTTHHDVHPAPQLAPLKMLDVQDVKSLNYGYGANGRSVQDHLHAKHLTDRFILRQTLLEGKPRIDGRNVCGRLRSKNADGKKVLPFDTWLVVVRAGLSDCSVARVEDAPPGGRATVVIKPIPSAEIDKVKYHNSLMSICGLTLRELAEAMRKASSKRPASRSRSRTPPVLASVAEDS